MLIILANRSMKCQGKQKWDTNPFTFVASASKMVSVVLATHIQNFMGSGNTKYEYSWIQIRDF